MYPLPVYWNNHNATTTRWTHTLCCTLHSVLFERGWAREIHQLFGERGGGFGTHPSLFVDSPFSPTPPGLRCSRCCCCYCVSGYCSSSILFKVRAQSKRLRMSITRSSRFNGPPDEGKALLMGSFFLPKFPSENFFLFFSFFFPWISKHHGRGSLRYEKVSPAYISGCLLPVVVVTEV